ncbi:MFS transporter [Candidatus Bathyarchaeota archaeon]|nr:MFS transporter [Candidatus Bathyarchaeota archaeon]MBS7613270.1 MFS transporter [Candidatus Bathyarchaeota archaeon]MBS7617657.1 MFS transporter [Candidatus Bathyarchaeota archaeon]
MNKNQLTSVYLAFIFSNLGYSLWYSLFPIYLRGLGFEAWQIGFVFSLLNLATSLSYLTLASFSETTGRGGSLVIGFSLSAAVLLTLAFIKSSACIVGLVVFYSFLGGLKMPVGEATIADMGGSLGLSLSTFYVATIAASIIGSALSGYLAKSLGFSMLFIIAGVLTTFSALFIAFTYGYSTTNFRIVKQTFRRSFENIKLMLSDGNMMKFTIALIFHSLGFSIINPLVQLYAKEALNLDEQKIGIIMAMWNGGLLVAQIPSGEFTDRFGGITVLAAHIVLSSVSWILYCSSKVWSGAVSSAFILGVVGALDMPARRTIIVQLKRKIDSASIIGYIDSLTNLAFIIGSSTGGILWNTLGYGMPFIVGSIINMFALIPLVTLISPRK